MNIPASIISIIEEYQILYTTQVAQKSKKWHDGKLKFYKMNKKVEVFNEASILVKTSFISKENISQDDEFDLGGLLVTIEEKLSTIEKDISQSYTQRPKQAINNSNDGTPKRITSLATTQREKGLSHLLSQSQRQRPVGLRRRKLGDTLLKSSTNQISMSPVAVSSRLSNVTSTRDAILNSPIPVPPMVHRSTTIRNHTPSKASARSNETSHIVFSSINSNIPKRHTLKRPLQNITEPAKIPKTSHVTTVTPSIKPLQTTCEIETRLSNMTKPSRTPTRVPSAGNDPIESAAPTKRQRSVRIPRLSSNMFEKLNQNLSSQITPISKIELKKSLFRPMACDIPIDDDEDDYYYDDGIPLVEDDLHENTELSLIDKIDHELDESFNDLSYDSDFDEKLRSGAFMSNNTLLKGSGNINNTAEKDSTQDSIVLNVHLANHIQKGPNVGAIREHLNDSNDVDPRIDMIQQDTETLEPNSNLSDTKMVKKEIATPEKKGKEYSLRQLFTATYKESQAIMITKESKKKKKKRNGTQTIDIDLNNINSVYDLSELEDDEDFERQLKEYQDSYINEDESNGFNSIVRKIFSDQEKLDESETFNGDQISGADPMQKITNEIIESIKTPYKNLIKSNRNRKVNIEVKDEFSNKVNMIMNKLHTQPEKISVFKDPNSLTSKNSTILNNSARKMPLSNISKSSLNRPVIPSIKTKCVNIMNDLLTPRKRFNILSKFDTPTHVNISDKSNMSLSENMDALDDLGDDSSEFSDFDDSKLLDKINNPTQTRTITYNYGSRTTGLDRSRNLLDATTNK